MESMQEIGRVENKFDTSTDHHEMKKHDSVIVIHKQFTDGLYRLDENHYIQVVFYFNQSKEYKLQTHVYSGEFKGVFASRSPKRPSMIGVTMVELLKIEKNRLYVKGLDALNDSPVLDIKPFVASMDTDFVRNIDDEKRKKSPRNHIMGHVRQENIKELLLLTGQIHGHFCGGVTIGVIASYLAMKRFNAVTDGMEDIVAIVEVNSCFVDGVQFVSGCTLGNNGLIYRDIGKTAVTFAKRKTGKGIRYVLNQFYMKEKSAKNPRWKELFSEVVNNNNRAAELMKEFKKISQETAFAMLEYDFDTLFTIQEVTVNIPTHAKLFDSFTCDLCKESTMITRKQKIKDKSLCPSCTGKMLQSDGNGIKEVDKHLL